MYEPPDACGPDPKVHTQPGSILDFLAHGPFSYFRKLLKLAGVEGNLNDPAFDGTVFAFPDSVIEGNFGRCIQDVLKIQDRGTALGIVRFSSLNRHIDMHLLSRVPVTYLNTRYDSKQVLVEVKPGSEGEPEVFVNGSARIISADHHMNNGTVHVVDHPIIPMLGQSGMLT